MGNLLAHAAHDEYLHEQKICPSYTFSGLKKAASYASYVIGGPTAPAKPRRQGRRAEK